MNLKLITLAALSAPLFGAYQYYYTDSLTSIDTTKWSPKTGVVDATTGGLTATDANGGSLISSLPVPLAELHQRRGCDGAFHMKVQLSLGQRLDEAGWHIPDCRWIGKTLTVNGV